MGYETKVVHPAAAQWLTDNGYTYQHEVTLPVGRVDFVAEHPNGQKMLVECKSIVDVAAVRQVLFYMQYVSGFIPCIVYPKGTSVPQSAIALIQSHNIQTIQVDVMSQTEYKRASHSKHISPFMLSLFLNEVTVFHDKRNTTPIYDYGYIIMKIRDYQPDNEEELVNICGVAMLKILVSNRELREHHPDQLFFRDHL